MPDPDSDDDFMSDKFLVDAPSAPTQSYSERRKQQSLRSLRAGQAKNLQSLKALEEERRREGLSRSLFEGAGESSARAAGGAGNGSGGSQTGGKNKAMEMMMKMGWTVGEGLGRKRSVSPDAEAKRARLRPSEGDDEGAAQAEDDDEDDSRPRGGIGSSRSRAPPSSSLPSGSAGGPGPGRTEPIRISLWAGRRGLAARSPSPPPLRSSGARDPDALDPKKLERLGRQTADFRSRQRDEYREKEVERKEGRARDLLVELDRAAGTKFHPLHVLPAAPLETLPRPLLKLIYPAQAISPPPGPGPSRSPSPVLPDQVEPFDRIFNSAEAQRLRDQIRRDMLSGEGELDDEDDLDLGAGGAKEETGAAASYFEKPVNSTDGVDYEGVDWPAQVPGTKKVLAMNPETHLTFLLDQLRHEHLFCFWCAYKYRSWEEMDAPGGCPGEEEDDH